MRILGNRPHHKAVCELPLCGQIGCLQRRMRCALRINKHTSATPNPLLWLAPPGKRSAHRWCVAGAQGEAAAGDRGDDVTKRPHYKPCSNFNQLAAVVASRSNRAQCPQSHSRLTSSFSHTDAQGGKLEVPWSCATHNVYIPQREMLVVDVQRGCTSDCEKKECGGAVHAASSSRTAQSGKCTHSIRGGKPRGEICLGTYKVLGGASSESCSSTMRSKVHYTTFYVYREQVSMLTESVHQITVVAARANAYMVHS